MTAVADPIYQQEFARAAAIWERLRGPWRVAANCAQSSDPLLNELLFIASPNAVVRDYGVASAMRQGLLAAGFLAARRLDDGSMEYVKAPTCPQPDQRTFTENEQERLDQIHAWDLEQLRREGDAAQAAAQFHFDSSLRGQVHNVVVELRRSISDLQDEVLALKGELAALRQAGGTAATAAVESDKGARRRAWRTNGQRPEKDGNSQ
jgi:hypothetical protein